MDQKARLRIALAIGAAAIVAGSVLLPPLLDWRAGKAYARIQKGDAESKVMMFLGSPDARGVCGAQLRWDQESLGANDGRCVHEARYRSRHGAWIVGYSADRVVVSKYFESAQ
jgi:hypothetical protein